MKRPTRWRARRLLAPLIYLAALLLLLEDWLWEVGARLVARIAAWPPLASLETRIRALGPYQALTIFLLPAVLLFPVKLLALLAMAHGHALLGLAVIIAAKVGGAAIVARLYSITRPALLSLAWFARWHQRFMDVKNRWIAALRATRAMRTILALRGALRRSLDALRARWRRQPGRMRRRLRRWIALWQAARRR